MRRASGWDCEPTQSGKPPGKVMQTKGLARRAPGKNFANREPIGQWAWGRNMLAQLGHSEEASMTVQVRTLEVRSSGAL